MFRDVCIAVKLKVIDSNSAVIIARLHRLYSHAFRELLAPHRSLVDTRCHGHEAGVVGVCKNSCHTLMLRPLGHYQGYISRSLGSYAIRTAGEQKTKTYNRRDSQMITHSSTSRPVQCLCMAERTHYTVVTHRRGGNSAVFSRQQRGYYPGPIRVCEHGSRDLCLLSSV
jgi:hypothetical protein